VKPEKGSPYLACTIAAKHGDATSPTTTKFDCRVSGSRAQAIVQQLEAAVKAEKRVFIGFRIGDFVPELFVYQNGKRKGETGVVNKGRLLQVTFAKVDGQTFELPPEDGRSGNRRPTSLFPIRPNGRGSLPRGCVRLPRRLSRLQRRPP
jgi:hypothetical protein